MTRKRIDWEAVERDFRVSTCTKTELCALHGLRPETLSRRITKDQAEDPTRWTRDLTAEVRRATSALLIREAVEVRIKEASQDRQDWTSISVLAAADQAKNVLLRHRKEALTLSTLVQQLSAELRTATVDVDLLRELAGKLGQAGLESDELAALHGQLRELTRLHNRAQTAQRLAECMTKLHAIERRAHSIPDEEPERDPLEDMPDDELEARIARALANRAATSPETIQLPNPSPRESGT